MSRPDSLPKTTPELLAPAGEWACARAAVENGADAIYFGLDRFNARMRAHNFTEADLPGLMEFLHRRGVRGYVTFNTLVFPAELQAAEQYLRSIIAAGVDAAIVQDVGMVRLIRRLSPDFPVHASTQMTVTSAAGVAFARELGCQLVVLARENSIREIEGIREALGSAAELPLEVFVHGALCVAYSGQCLTSESLGGRSANRGECAQACRMPYELISDGKKIDLGHRHYLLSPQDLAGIDVLPELVRVGVASLKIEGRLKSPEYVASVTKVYRQALDRLAGAHLSKVENLPNKGTQSLTGGRPTLGGDAANERYELEMSFSRGLYSGWFQGIDNQSLVHAEFAKKRGVFLGEIEDVRVGAIGVRLVAPLKPGDGVVIDTGTGGDDEQGGRVVTMNPNRGLTWVGFLDRHVDFSRVHPGDRLWKTNDPVLDREVRRTFEGDEIRHRRPVHFEVHGAVGIPLTVIARDETGAIAQVPSAISLTQAEKRPLTPDTLGDQLGRLGGTPFLLGRMESHLAGEVMLPMSELNRIRRELVTELERQRIQPRRWTLSAEKSAGEMDAAQIGAKSPGPQPELVVLVRTLEQLDAALEVGVETIYCELEDPKRYRDAVRRVREASGCEAKPRSIWVAPPRIFKPGEEWILRLVRSCDADGYLVRNYDHLQFFADQPCRGDFSLNVANGLTAEYFLQKYRLERVTASYDLNVEQLLALLGSAPPEWFEVTLHQHMPMFHMEHCVFCAFLSKGTDYRNCGRPCDTHQVRLRDRMGAEHVLKADAGCRNTLYNARAQTGAEFAGRLMEAGLRHFRIEFAQEEAGEVRKTIGRYRALLRGEITGTQVWQELKLLHQLGVTRGQLDRAEVRRVAPSGVGG